MLWWPAIFMIAMVKLLVAQGGHDLGAIAGADLGGVLAVGGVADVLQGRSPAS